MIDKEKLLIIVGSAIALMVVAALLYMMQAEKNTTKAANASSGMEALLQNYDSIKDYNTQVAVWTHIYKNCPYWTAEAREMLRRHGGENDTLDSRIALQADYAISKGRKPADYMAKCNDKYVTNSAAYDECIKKKENRNIAGWIMTGGLHRLFSDKDQFFNVQC